ncbi:MAG: glycosyl hydrolase, partial [Candidatus Latescibacteria bacterium]|nr:glycosyl hydrolase [Candidatus Latescibacterota bacterium]
MPEISSKPISFWFLNHDLGPDELRRQLDEMHSKGFGGVFMHPRDGLLTPYNSERWWTMVGAIVDHGKKIGLDVWLYDEDPYPSGVAGGQVVFDHPEFVARSLEVTRLDAEGGRRILLDGAQGPLVGAYAVGSDGAIVRLTEMCGWVRPDWNPPRLSRTLYYPPYGDHGNPHWRGSTGTAHSRLDWTAPNGEWRIVMFVERHHFGSRWGSGYVDCLNPEAIAYFIELTHERYAERFAEHFGGHIPGIFTDEPKVHPVYAWSPALPDLYRQMWSQELIDVLPHMAMDIDDKTPRIRHQYRRAVAKGFREAFSKQVGRWCETNRLLSTGHASPEEDPIGQVYMTPGLMGWLREQQIPGFDLIADVTGDRQRPLLQMGPKLAGSVAHQAGREHVLCEAFAVVDWVQTIADMKRTCDWVMVLGANLLAFHGQHYSIDGLRKYGTPPSQFFQAGYWRFFGDFSKHIERIGAFLTGGTPKVEVAMLHPEVELSALLPLHSDEAEALVNRFGRALDSLLSSQIDCDLIDEEGLETAVVEDGTLKLGDAIYRGLVLPGVRYITDGAAEVIGTLLKAGFQVWSLTGDLLTLDGERLVLDGIHLVGDEELVDAVTDKIPPPIEVDPPSRLLIQHRQEGDRHLIFVVNNDDKRFAGRITVKLDGSATITIQDGEPSTYLTNAPIPMSLPPWGSATIAVNPLAEEVKTSSPKRWTTLADISRGWRFSTESDNVGVLRDWHVVTSEAQSRHGFAGRPTMDLLTEAMLPSDVSGLDEVWLVCRFDAESVPSPLWLVRESDISPAQVDWWVNDRAITRWEPVIRYDVMNQQAEISSYVVEGLNRVVMRLIGLGAVDPDQRQVRATARLFGGFEVYRPWAHPSPIRLKRADASIELEGLPSWTETGYRDYSGVGSYSCEIDVTEEWMENGPLALSCSVCDDVAELVVNDIDAGVRAWMPYRWTGLEELL